MREFASHCIGGLQRFRTLIRAGQSPGRFPGPAACVSRDYGPKLKMST